MISRDDVLAAYPLRDFLEKQGCEIKQQGKEHVCRCLFHDDKNPSMRLNLDKGVFYCDVCDIGGTTIDLTIRLRGLSVKDALQTMAKEAGLTDPDGDKIHTAATYNYCDSYGRPVMKVDRIEKGFKKKFRQYHTTDKGEDVNGIEGIQRVLYRMEEWAGQDEVALVEGEKCVHAMEEIGFYATTNPGGSAGWLPAYASYLKDKHVIIIPDNDKPGEKWLAEVLASLEGKVESLKIVRVPDVYGDVADLITAQGLDIGSKTILKIIKATPRIKRGVMIALMSAEECYEAYKDRVSKIDVEGVDFARWIPSFRKHTRILLPGDMAVILADTGVGKTCCMNNLAVSQAPHPCIMFQLELGVEAMSERFIAHDHQVNTLDVENTVKGGKEYTLDGWKHIYICPKSSVSIEDMEQIINKSELKIGRRPLCVFVDYIGLMQGGTGKRYERMSTLAESLKVLARSTNTVMVVASQISRKDNRTEIDLHAGKDSGSIENSAQLLVGAWRPEEDRITLKILKNTKRAGQPEVECLFDGDKQNVRELLYENTGGQ